MSTMKRCISLLLVLCLCLSMMPIRAEAVTAGDGTFTWPLPTKYPITSGWYYNGGGYHGASDFAAPIGNPVYAIADGTVYTAQDYKCQGSHYPGYETCLLGKSCASIAAGSTGTYGNFIIIDHGYIDGKRTYSYYAHLLKDSFHVAKGQTVQQGQQIASSGNSGNSKGAHLHVEIRMGGRDKSNRVDPSLYLTKMNTTTTPTGVDLGTNFYAYIINTGHWKHLTNDGNNISMRSETGARNQVWYFERQSDLSYKITSVSDGNCMEVCNFGTTDGTNVQTYPYNGNTAQLWNISGTSGAYVFRAKCASTVLDVNGNSSEEGTNVQMWTYNGSGAQLFQVWKLNDYDITAPSSPSVSLSNSNYSMKNGNYLKNSEDVIINWTSSNADSYRIRIKYSADSGYLVDRDVGSNTSFTYSPSQEGKYTVSVCASNEAGSSAWVSRDFYVRGLYGKNWVSNSAAGDTVTSFQSGDRVYLNYKIYDKATGDLFFTYYNSDYPVTLEIIDPNGTTAASKSYTRDDNDYISCECTTPGTYTAKVTFNGTVYTSEFTVNASNYTISYNANGGTGAPGSQTKQYGVPLTLSSTVPTGKSFTVTFNGNGGAVSQSSKQVYQRFSGWNTKSNGSGDSYSPGETYTAETSCMLYAQWDDAVLGSVTEPVRDGYHFLGWYKSKDTNSDGFPIGRPCESMAEITSNIVLYAMWSAADILYYGDVDLDGSVTATDVAKINQYLQGKGTLAYSVEEFLLRADLNRDGDVTSDDLTIVNSLRLNQTTQEKLSEAHKSTSVSVYPKRSYNHGENLDTAGLAIDILFNTGVSYTISDGLRVSGYDPNKSGNQTLTVQYYQFTATYTVDVNPQAYTISYDANGGSGAPGNQTKKHDVDLTLASAIPTRFGYTFQGWSTGSTATTAGYLPGSSFAINANTTLYAVWTPAADISADVTNSTYSASVPFSNGCQYFVFTPSFTGKVRFESTGSGDAQIYLYDAKGNQIASNDDGGSGTNFLLTQAVTAGTKYYAKVKYYGSATGTISFSVKRAYDIVYDANGGTRVPGIQTKLYDDALTLSTDSPIRENYSFAGWATHESATNASYQPGSSFTDNADTTLYAVWVPVNCVLNYDANGGVGAPGPQNSPYGELLTISSSIPTRFGYSFQGWNTSASDTDAACFPGGSLTLGGNVTLYAVWERASAIDSYVSNRDYEVTIPFANGCAYYVFTPAPERFQFESYGDGDTQIFLYDADGSLLASDDDSGGNLNFLLNYDFVSGNTYYVKVQYYGSGFGSFVFNLARAYDITYNANGGTDAPSAQVKTHSTDLLLSTDIPSRSGYDFLGWATNPTATSVNYQPGDNYTTNSNLSLYAVWGANCDKGHSYTYKATKNPTTSATGTLTGTCSKCSGTTTVTLPKLNTTDYTYKVTKEATCTAAGTGRYTWKTTTYGSFYFDVTIAAKGHSYTSKVTAPTCTEQGYTTYTCACGHSYKDNYTSATGHSYSYKATKAPTTSTTGTLTGTCSKCSGTTTVTLPKLNTTDYTYKVTKEATCTVAGTGRYTWKTTTYGTFTFDVTIAAKGHSYTSKVTAPTCTEQGYTTYTCACGHSYKDNYTSATGHSYSYKATKNPTTSATGTLTGTCSKCSGTTTVTLPKLNTTDYTYKVTKEATCTAAGTGRYTWKTTTYGSFYFDVSIAAKGHSYTSKVTAPTCTEQGYTTYTCACGHSYKDNYTSATGHSYSYKATKNPTTSATGTLTGTCSKCSGTTTVTLPKLNTTDYTYKVTKEATCTAAGTGRYTWKTTTYGTFTFDVTIAAKGHSYTSKVTAPTCTAQGYTTYTCACGHSYKDNYTNATGHSYTYKATKAPTTSATGTLTGTCSKCSGTTTVTLPKLNTTDYTYKVTKEATCTANGAGRYTWKTTTYGSFYFDVTIAAKGHSYNSVVTAPTCTQKGYTTHTCHCGNSFVDSYVDALGHDMGDWAVVNAATCTKAGSERRDCSRCDHYETRNVSATGHSYETHVTAPTCTESGYTQYICTVCGSSYTSDYTSPTGHDHKAAVTAPTCTKQGYTTYTCHCGDSYVSDYTNALGHDMGDWAITEEATCSENGHQIRECSRCDYSETRTIDALGHAWNDGVVTIEPTEDIEGEMTYTCERCSLTRTEVIPALDHEHRYDAVVTAPTCTQKGYTTHTCSCGHSFVDTYVDALGHDMGDWFAVTHAACTENGLEQRDCSRCDYCETREIPASGHTYESMTTDPTCINMGFSTHTCHCGDSYTDSYIDPLGHSFTDYRSDGNATCTEDGTKTASCDRCDATDTQIDVGSAHGHDFSEWTVVEEATQTSDGLESRSCYYCGLEETRVIPRLENPFTDVPEGSFFYDAVMWAIENDITNGTGPTTFAPGDLCLRAHVVTFLWRAAGSPEPQSADNPFEDVQKGSFYEKAVLWAVENGITTGTDATHFSPGTVCNRATVVTFLYRAFGSPQVENTGNPFTDVPAGQWFTAPVLWAVQEGITNGTSATTFGPGTSCNRAQIVTFLYRAYN